MNLSADKDNFLIRLNSFNPEELVKERSLALFSAAITFDDNDITNQAIQLLSHFEIGRQDFYEIVLQSYLFLGFPRMLQAVDVLEQNFPNTEVSRIDKIQENEAQKWYDDGISLCMKVYQQQYEPLKNKVVSMAPEIFRWMIIEGYGKVLSRGRINIVTRELSIIAFLMMENRTRQLRSHIQGAMNIGASAAAITLIVNDIGDAAGAGFVTANEILTYLGIDR